MRKSPPLPNCSKDIEQQWGQHTEHEYVGQAGWDWTELGLPLDYNTSNHSHTVEMKQTHDLPHVCSVHILKKGRFRTVLRLCAEWIISQGDIGLFSFASNSKTTLRPTWEYSGLWMSFFFFLVFGTESSVQESGCSPKTIFVRVALFQTFTVYYILQPPLLSQMGSQIPPD